MSPDIKILFLAWTAFTEILANFYIPGLPQKRYIELRDINLGAIFPIYGYSKVKPCGDKLRSTVILQFIEGLVYAVDKINEDSSILPQAKLGFIIVDDCLKETTTIAQSLSFLPQRDVCTCNDTCYSVSSVVNKTATPIYDVVGVIGSMKSSNTIAAATLLGPGQVPQVSYSSSSDELSDKTMYPYFLRVVPPDKYQVDGIVKLIDTFGWSYISVVYTEGSYGELAFKNLKKRTEEFGVCIGASHKVAEGAIVEEYDKIALDLRNHAKVVILFTGPTNARGVLSAVSRTGDGRRYIWIGSDGWAKRIANLGDFWKTALGAFTFTFYSEEVPAFTTWFKSKDPLSEKDPWFKEFWETHFSCSFEAGSTNPCVSSEHLSSKNGFQPVPTVTPVMDAVQTFARSIHALLQFKCPDKVGTEARECITGPNLLSYMKNLSFTGNNGHVSFDENGDLQGKYMIDQLVERENTYEQIKIGVYDTLTKSIKFNERTVTWRYVDVENTGLPESVCSKPCGPGEFLIQKELPCCWECKKCRDNEYITDNGTNCAPCPIFWWPDPESQFRSCTQIQATHIVWGEPLAIMLLVFSALGVAATVLVLILYIRQNSSRCIKASSREMSYLMLAGVFLGYLAVVGLVAPPDTRSCKINYFCFCVSFTCIYSPLLTRTTRIYRIFSSTKSTQRPKFISPKSQVFIASTLILVQITVSIAVCFVYNPTSQLTMPVRTDRYVELSCDFTVPGLASFLSYNLVLVVVCSFFAFKTRKLPDNFNESRFISMCVYTTLVLLLAFIPSYFTAGRQYLKTVMLSTVLILNKTVAICFLYLPKIYAAVYLEHEGQRQVATSRLSRNTQVTSLSNGAERNVNFLQVEPVG